MIGQPMKRMWWNSNASLTNRGICSVIVAGFQFGHLGDLNNIEIFGGFVPPVITFYLLQEDGVSRIILENGTGFLELEH